MPPTTEHPNYPSDGISQLSRKRLVAMLKLLAFAGCFGLPVFSVYLMLSWPRALSLVDVIGIIMINIVSVLASTILLDYCRHQAETDYRQP